MRSAYWLVMVAAACGGSKDSSSTPDATTADAPVDGAAPFVPATRFAEQAENRPVPSSGLSDGFAQRSSFNGVRHWSTLDLDGDNFLEIVQTNDTAFTQRVWDAAGNPYWKVFTGGATGWTMTATNWPVPKNGRADGFFAVGVTGGGEWNTLDIDGDKRRDIVFTSDPATGAVWDATGLPHWKVFLGTASGFSPTAIAWRVPTSGTTGGFTMTSNRNITGQWASLDITNDGKPDLIQTQDPVTGRVWDSASSPHWKVYENTGTGYATQAMLWRVPANGFMTGFFTPQISNGVQQWTTVDLDADGRLDLVQTADTATGTVWDPSGAPYWKVFRGTTTGFETAPQTWRVPPSGLSDGFSMTASQVSQRRWSLFDLDGDGDLDLVQTGDTSFAQRVWDATGAPYWKVFVNKRDGFSLELHRWNVPKGATDGFFDLTSAVGSLHWFMADIDRDGYPDLVHTMNPTTSTVWDATGAAYWKVFRGQP